MEAVRTRTFRRSLMLNAIHEERGTRHLCYKVQVQGDNADRDIAYKFKVSSFRTEISSVPIDLRTDQSMN